MAKLPMVGADPYTYPGHSGVDFLRGASWLHKPFYASGPGTVLRLSHNAAGGNWIVIKYDGVAHEVGYCHMDNHDGCPRPGSRVVEGTRLGYVGRTGTRVTGPHVHVEDLAVHTDEAIWAIFDRNRVVGQGGGGIGASQRQVGATTANRRKSPDTKSAPLPNPLKPHAVGNFVGWIRGESVSGNNVWFKGISGNWFWSGGFTSTSTAGLPDLNPAPVPAPAPAAGGNPFGIGDVRGLQKIAKLYGYTGRIDNDWGAGSAGGFAQFLRRNWGYRGNDTLGPVMWASIARWLRKRWGYIGNDVPGPNMRAALARANAANLAQL